MSAALLDGLLQRARGRVALDALLVALPLALLPAVFAWRLAGAPAGAVAAGLGLLGLGLHLARRLRPLDRAWLLRRLHAARADLEDSGELLHADPAQLSPLQRLQRERLERRLRERPLPEQRPSWSPRPIAAAWLLLAAAVALAVWWPRATIVPAGPPFAPATGQAPAPAARLVAQSLQVQPPAYTGIAASSTQAMDVEAPVGSVLQWRLRFAPQPESVDLLLHDGRRIGLARDGEDWTGRLQLQASTLYRIVPAGADEAGSPPLHRLDALPDTPPRVRVLAPERGVTLLAPGQRDWLLRFEAEDDHGLAPRARLLITRTEGSGENLRFHDQVRELQGSGERRVRRFEARLSPAEFGLARGEDLVARLEVLDNRAPQPQLARSASLILRWPPEPVLGADGLDGLARQVLPAYFRSQRQIIIDAEALLRERARLPVDEFERRSDLIGVDQRLLRLRYGQFLGEESEGGNALPTSDLPTSDLPTSDLPTGDLPTSDAPASDVSPAREGHEGHAHGDGHDHGEGPAAGGEGFGNVGDVLEQFGHTHDIAEAATLLDPQTRDTLRKALREMWQSELHLRQADPAQALPYANRALELIKQVQQAERIYLQRVGTLLPPIDETRRLGGDRSGLGPRPLPALAASGADEAVLGWGWRALDAASPDALGATLDRVQDWAETHRDRLEDPLAWIAAIDALRQDPACAGCRAELRGLLWSAMPRPRGGFPVRVQHAAAARYLDALGAGEDAP